MESSESTEVTPTMERRAFLGRIWRIGAGFVAAAGAWTTWDLLRPLPTAGFGGKVRTVPASSVAEGAIVEVPAARAYLIRRGDELVALSEKCTHLGCRVPYCGSSGRFECPCHGSVFDPAGGYLAGPAPRGMDTYPVEVGEDGLVYIDTGARTDGPEPGSVPVDSEPKGPSCATEGGH